MIRKINEITINPPKLSPNSTAIAGTTLESANTSIYIPANTFVQYDVFGLETRILKTGSAGAYTVRMRASTTGSIIGSTLLGTVTGAAGDSFLPMMRRLVIKTMDGSGSGTVCADPTASHVSDASSAQPVVSLAINWTVDQFILVTTQANSSSDSILAEFLISDCPEALNGVVVE